MGPDEIKNYIYTVLTSSRELTNYCQESVKSFQNKKISYALNNFHVKDSIDFITNSLTDEDQSFFELNEIEFDNPKGAEDKPIYSQVIAYMENYLIESNL